jgi:hypothetical protein
MGVAQTTTTIPETYVQNVNAYVAAGGRFYMSHYEKFFLWPLSPDTSAWSNTGVEDPDALTVTMATNVAINLGIPKGNAFAKWAQTVGVSTTFGNIATIQNARVDVLSATAPSIPWLTGEISGATPDSGTPNVYNYSFYTGATACGKVHYADFHVSAGSQTTAEVFPAECTGTAQDPTATSLFEFFFFDTLSCVQDDTQAPQPPPL